MGIARTCVPARAAVYGTCNIGLTTIGRTIVTILIPVITRHDGAFSAFA